MTEPRTIDCPQCGKPARVDQDNPYRPFCSRRCKLIDLGDWLDEENRIPDASARPWSGGEDDFDPTH